MSLLIYWLGKREGLHARLKPFVISPSLSNPLLANLRSLKNKLDELQAKITTQKDFIALTILLFLLYMTINFLNLNLNTQFSASKYSERL